MRDNFSQKVKNDLAGRAGYRCSNPDCRILTIEAKDAMEGTVNIGEAAHICAASPGGMRYNPEMSSKERSSAENGIWLCRNCAAMIDRDSKYTIAMLYKWKYYAESQTDSINSHRISESDNNVLNSITTVFEGINVMYMLREHDFQNDFQREYLTPLFDLYEELDKPSKKLQNKELDGEVDELVQLIGQFRGLIAVKGGPSIHGNGSFCIDKEEDQKECNSICNDIWNKYKEVMESKRNLS